MAHLHHPSMPMAAPPVSHDREVMRTGVLTDRIRKLLAMPTDPRELFELRRDLADQQNYLQMTQGRLL